jgi:hypothetical protein
MIRFYSRSPPTYFASQGGVPTLRKIPTDWDIEYIRVVYYPNVS